MYIKITNLMSKLKSHHETSYKHSMRVASLSLKISSELNLSSQQRIDLHIGALLHDIGKLKISQKILSSPSKLSEEEFSEIKKHPEYGLEVLEEMNIEVDSSIKEIILNHHERLNGAGYPRKLKKDEISLLVKIVAVADSFDAMTEKRSYNNPYSKEEALSRLDLESYDEDIVIALRRALKNKA